MDSKTVLQKLEQRNFKEKKILSPLKKCLKKLSFKSSADLWNLKSLAFWLYVYDYNQHALKVCKVVHDLEFKGDFNIWTPVEKIILLEIRIHREHGKTAAVKKNLKKLLTPMQPHQEAFKRRLSFDWLSDVALARYLQADDLKNANEIRFSDLGDLFFIRELGKGQTDLDGKKVDTARAEKRIQEYIRILKEVK